MVETQANDHTEVGIIIGSHSDEKIIHDSNMLEILNDIGIRWERSIISAHRNPEDLTRYCKDALEHGVQLFIGIAGMAAALPGAIAANNRETPVIGVALSSSPFGALDSLLSITRMPPGVPVAVAGIDQAGCINAALLAAQILGLHYSYIKKGLSEYISKHNKPSEIRYIL